MVRPLHIKNAKIWNGDGGEQRDLFTTDRVVESRPDDALEIDLDGYTIFPGLINAHDHLELNHFPRTKFRDVYPNAHEWGEDIQARLDESPFKELRAYPLEDRCFIGGLKNLLCGATTVAHHNPPHKSLFRKDFSVRVLRHYGWSHSLHFSSEEEIKQSYANTPKDVPWFIHLAEGTDDVAAGEFKRLKALGCVGIGKRTIIVHGVGLTEEDIQDVGQQIAGFIWCPSTNLYLLGQTVDMGRRVYNTGKTYFALGSDSRLSADGDFLDEIRAAMKTETIDLKTINEMIWANPAQILNNRDIGHLASDAHADYITMGDDEKELIGARRADLTLVVKGGVPQIGDPDVMAKFPHIPTVRATLDGRPKYIHKNLARRIIKCTLSELGLHIDERPRKTMFFWRN